MASEHRKTPRYSVRQVVEIAHGRHTVVWGDAINLSKSGILCRTSGPVSPSIRVLVSMFLPNGARVDCDGVVVRSQIVDGEHRAAIEFSSFHGNGSAGLERFLSYLGSRATAAGERSLSESSRLRSP